MQMSKTRPLLVLAGGYGTRLRSVVADVPKPLAPIGEEPFLQIQLRNWIEQGVDEFVFLLHYQHAKILEFLNKAERSSFLGGRSVRCIMELEPLGTGGAIANAVFRHGITGNFLVTNADTWLSSGIKEVEALTTPGLGVVRIPNQERYGAVQFNADGSVVDFGSNQIGTKGGWVNAGIYLFNAADFGNWQGGRCSLEAQILPELVKRRRLTAVPLEAVFIDIGVPEDYQRFCSWYQDGRRSSL
jgi:NDP-sugar pyrophosphorylase family protein